MNVPIATSLPDFFVVDRKEYAVKNGFVILGSVLVGLWLLSNPRCARGCRTIAEHLVAHGIDEFLAGLA